MAFQQVATYIVFGFGIGAAIYPMVFSGHLWKPKFRKQCLIPAGVSVLVGVLLEATNALDQLRGLTVVVMASALLYIGNFQFFRSLFLRKYGAEPYITSKHSWIGGKPIDMYSSEGKDGTKRKFRPEREIGSADFLFTFCTHLIPALLILFAVYLVRIMNS